MGPDVGVGVGVSVEIGVGVGVLVDTGVGVGVAVGPDVGVGVGVGSVVGVGVGVAAAVFVDAFSFVRSIFRTSLVFDVIPNLSFRRCAVCLDTYARERMSAMSCGCETKITIRGVMTTKRIPEITRAGLIFLFGDGCTC